jgi:hypothetical protein
MEKQQTFASVAWTQKGKVTRHERFRVTVWSGTVLVGVRQSGREPRGLPEPKDQH